MSICPSVDIVSSNHLALCWRDRAAFAAFVAALVGLSLNGLTQSRGHDDLVSLAGLGEKEKPHRSAA